MPIRYCGKIKIDCKLVPASHMPHGEQYLCTLYTKYPTKRGWTRMWNEHVGLPGVIRTPIDSPAAYDEAAHAALSFAQSDAKLSDDVLEFTHDGYRIRRRPSDKIGGLSYYCRQCDRKFSGAGAFASHNKHTHKVIS